MISADSTKKGAYWRGGRMLIKKSQVITFLILAHTATKSNPSMKETEVPNSLLIQNIQ